MYMSGTVQSRLHSQVQQFFVEFHVLSVLPLLPTTKNKRELGVDNQI